MYNAMNKPKIGIRAIKLSQGLLPDFSKIVQSGMISRKYSKNIPVPPMPINTSITFGL
jgi:hypothetical protein